jgi:hypothetical protein
LDDLTAFAVATDRLGRALPTIPRFGGLEISFQGWRVANPNIETFEDTLGFHQQWWEPTPFGIFAQDK